MLGKFYAGLKNFVLDYCEERANSRARPWKRWLSPGPAWGQSASRFPPFPPTPRERRTAPLTRPYGPCPNWHKCPNKTNCQTEARLRATCEGGAAHRAGGRHCPRGSTGRAEGEDRGLPPRPVGAYLSSRPSGRGDCFTTATTSLRRFLHENKRSVFVVFSRSLYSCGFRAFFGVFLCSLWAEHICSISY